MKSQIPISNSPCPKASISSVSQAGPHATKEIVFAYYSDLALKEKKKDAHDMLQSDHSRLALTKKEMLKIIIIGWWSWSKLES